MILTAIDKCNTSRSVVDTTFFNSGYLMGTLTGDFFSSEKKTLFIIFIIHFTRFFFVKSSLNFFSYFSEPGLVKTSTYLRRAFNHETWGYETLQNHRLACCPFGRLYHVIAKARRQVFTEVPYHDF